MVKYLRVKKSFRVSVGNRNIRLEPGLECEAIDESLGDYLIRLDNHLEWWVPKDKLSFYFEEVSDEQGRDKSGNTG